MAASLAIFLLALTFSGQVWGRGVVRIRFVRYENTEGTDEGGGCCDRVIGCQKNGCDHAFKVCLDDISRARQNGTEAVDCRIGWYETTETPNHDIITFGTKIGTTPNPLNFTFTGPIPMQMALRVLVEDEDKGKDDKVELLKDVITVPASNVASGREFSDMVSGRTKLSLGISIQCDANYYGSDCNTLCQPPSSRDHYSCNPSTGAKTCHPGWTGPKCNQQAETCTSDWCFNNVKCVIINGKKSCRCPENVSGPRCELHVCDQRCADTAGGYCKRWGTRNDEYRCVCGRGHTARDSSHGEYCE